MTRRLASMVTGLAMLAVSPALSIADEDASMDVAEFQRCLEAADSDDLISRNECIGVASSRCIGVYFTASGKANCWAEERKLWDETLNHNYRTLRDAEMPDEFRDDLRQAQRAWIKLRDADCGLYQAMGIGGAPQSQLYESCMLDHTARRANALLEIDAIVRQVN